MIEALRLREMLGWNQSLGEQKWTYSEFGRITLVRNNKAGDCIIYWHSKNWSAGQENRKTVKMCCQAGITWLYVFSIAVIQSIAKGWNNQVCNVWLERGAKLNQYFVMLIRICFKCCYTGINTYWLWFLIISVVWSEKWLPVITNQFSYIIPFPDCFSEVHKWQTEHFKMGTETRPITYSTANSLSLSSKLDSTPVVLTPALPLKTFHIGTVKIYANW